jgi:putative ABC transport system permease protein
VSAVWRVARAAVRRRRLQTIVVGLVVAVSTATIVLALGLLTSAAAPFDQAYEQQHGAHLEVTFDSALVSPAEVAATADRRGVEGAAGPFGQVVLDSSITPEGRQLSPLATVGRADPGGEVDRINVWEGRWATKPGEIVVSAPPGNGFPIAVGDRLEIPGRPAFTIVGYAYSVSRSADAWVTPDQLTALQPTALSMVYRFDHAATAAEVRAGRDTVTAGLPAKAVLGAQSYLTRKAEIMSETGVYIPFLIVFGCIGLAVAVLIVANVVSGAVVAGFRNIGVLKAIGFSPDQVMAVYLVMVIVPAIAGCVLGAVGGLLVANPILTDAFEGFGAADIGVDAWVVAVALVGTPLIVALAALVSALRARGLPAAAAISAGSAPRTGRALGIQRRLAGIRLPRSVSLGLGVPFARPARSVLTLAAVVLGVLTVTLAIGVTLSVTAYRGAVDPTYTDRVSFTAGGLGGGPGGGDVQPREPGAEPVLSDSEDEALLRSTDGALRVAATTRQTVQVVSGNQLADITFYRGDTSLGPRIIEGHWPRAGEVAAPSRFLNRQGLRVGDRITVQLDDRRVTVRVSGISLTNSASVLFADWSTLDELAPDARADTYTVQLKPGTDQAVYTDAVADGDPGLAALPPDTGGSSQAVVLIGTSTALTVVLAIVAALGVFNTVALNARERRRDLGMLKSIGMTPRQVTVMMVTSMGALGVAGGLVGVPLGVLAHQVIAPAMMRAAQSDVFDVVMDVYHAPVLAALALAGIVIAVLGAAIPARAAARVPIAAVLHNE